LKVVEPRAAGFSSVEGHNLRPEERAAQFEFFGELKELLLPERREGEFVCRFRGDQSVKHLIESLGVPHTEAGRILVGGQPVEFGYLVQDGDRVEVYPASSPGAGPGNLPDEPRFVLDNHLGRLAASLRMLGFDAAYRNDYQDEELARIAAGQGRILLTRDRRLLMRRAVVHGYLVRSPDPETQLGELLERFALAGWIAPFRRCLRCNTPLETVRKEEILDRLEPLTKQYYHEFKRCPACNQIYWKGSHYERMMQRVEEVAR
jgi:uncharacterized protein with PIN domain